MTAYSKFSAGFRIPETLPDLQTPPLADLATLATAPIKPSNFEAEKRRWTERWHKVRRIIMTKRGLDEKRASQAASTWLQVDWMNEQRETQVDPSICHHCSQRFTNDNRNPGLAFLNGDRGHVWVHHDCYAPWTDAAEAKARAVMGSYGIDFYD